MRRDIPWFRNLEFWERSRVRQGGSEVGRATVITDAETCEEDHFPSRRDAGGRHCRPELTVRLPLTLTAANSTDASHLLEAYCAPCYHPLADAITIEGICLVRLAGAGGA